MSSRLSTLIYIPFIILGQRIRKSLMLNNYMRLLLLLLFLLLLLLLLQGRQRLQHLHLNVGHLKRLWLEGRLGGGRRG